MESRAEARRIRSLRPERTAIDPWRPIAITVERERAAAGPVRAATVFLAGAECPFTCVFCDLWRYTLEEATPPGAIVAQIDRALVSLAGLGIERLKLYNASNFFDPRAVPSSDDEAILRRLAPLGGVTVECHPRLLNRRFERYAEALGERLEVALGLETVHPDLLARLNKGATLDDFALALGRIRSAGARARAFVLVGLPFLGEEEQLEWVVRSAEWALERGAEVVSLIPVRGGNGEMERLAASGEWRAPALDLLEGALLALLHDPRGVSQVDPWDLETVEACARCGPERRRRLARMSLRGREEPPVACDRCGACSVGVAPC